MSSFRTRLKDAVGCMGVGSNDRGPALQPQVTRSEEPLPNRKAPTAEFGRSPKTLPLALAAESLQTVGNVLQDLQPRGKVRQDEMNALSADADTLIRRLSYTAYSSAEASAPKAVKATVERYLNQLSNQASQTDDPTEFSEQLRNADNAIEGLTKYLSMDPHAKIDTHAFLEAFGRAMTLTVSSPDVQFSDPGLMRRDLTLIAGAFADGLEVIAQALKNPKQSELLDLASDIRATAQTGDLYRAVEGLHARGYDLLKIADNLDSK
jgi:hypothetical protein